MKKPISERSETPPRPSRGPLVAASLPLLLGLWVLAHIASTSQLNQDEFQHVHIAWETLQRKLLYRDFHEHHGPLTAWFGALVMKLRGASAASAGTFDLFRSVNLGGLAVLFGLVVLLVRRTGGSWAAGLLAAGLLSTSGLYAWVGVQHRPETLQNLLVLAALLLLVERRDALAGLCLGLLPAVHPKSLLAVGFVLAGVALAGAARIERTSPRAQAVRTEAHRWAWLAGGLVGVQAVVVSLFAALGALDDYVREAWVENFGAVGRAAAGSHVASSTRGKLLTVDAPVACACAVLMVASAVVLWRMRRDPKAEAGLLVFGAALASLGTLVLPFRAYVLLLPMALVAATLGIAAQWRVGGVTPVRLVAALAAVLALKRGVSHLRDRPNPERALHRQALAVVLKATPRDEPVYYVWPSRCAAYVFNADPGHVWRNTNRAVCDVAASTSDERFERSFREQVMGGRVRYVALDPPYVERLPAEFRTYLTTHFRRLGCLWERT